MEAPISTEGAVVLVLNPAFSAAAQVHFLELSSEVDFAPGSPQQNFIISDLAAVNRSLTPWIVGAPLTQMPSPVGLHNTDASSRHRPVPNLMHLSQKKCQSSCMCLIAKRPS